MNDYELKCDCHTHTLFSRHAYSTLEENITAAMQQGLEAFATTDHFSNMLNENGNSIDFRNYQFFFNYANIPRNWHNVSIYRGAEADIVDTDGNLFGHDIYTSFMTNGDALEKLENLLDKVTNVSDFLISSIHGKDFLHGCTKQQLTSMYCRAMMHPKVLIVGHPGRSGVDFDIDELVKFAGEHHRLIEINEHSGEQYFKEGAICRSIAIACMKYGTQIAVNSDAHISYAVGKFEGVRKMLSEIQFPNELIATRNREAFISALQLIS